MPRGTYHAAADVGPASKSHRSESQGSAVASVPLGRQAVVDELRAVTHEFILRRPSSRAEETGDMLRQHISTNYQECAQRLEIAGAIRQCERISDIFGLLENPKFAKDFAALQRVTSEVDVAKLLARRLTNMSQASSLHRLCERDELMNALNDAVRRGESTPANSKPGLVLGCGMRGIGKTASLMMWVFTRMHARCAHGRVLVLEPRLWPTKLVTRFLAARNDESEFVISLIRDHLVDMYGPISEPLPATVAAAYKEWYDTTRTRHNLSDDQHAELKPIIVIDSCEEFVTKAHVERAHSTPPCKYNLLEALAAQVPGLHCVVALGTMSEITLSQEFQSHVISDVLSDGLLSVLSEEASFEWFAQAVKRQDSVTGVYDEHIHRIIHALSAGVPRLMAHALLGTGARSCRQALQTLFEGAEMFYHDVTSPNDAQLALLLASAVKWNRWPLPLPPSSDPNEPPVDSRLLPTKAAAWWSMGAASSSTQVVCPPVFAKFVNAEAVQRLTNLRGVDLASIVMPFDPKTLECVGERPAVARGIPFEHSACHALLVRYALARWERRSSGVAHADWVPLDMLLSNNTGTVGGHFERTSLSHLCAWEVNLSEGFRAAGVKWTTYAAFSSQLMYGLQWNGSSRAPHHDGYMWGRRRTVTGVKEVPIALQMRHGTAKTFLELAPQLHQSKQSGSGKVALLLSLHGGEPKGPAYLSLRDKSAACDHDDVTRFAEVNMENLMDTSAILAL